MEKLVAGVHQFKKEVFQSQRELFRQLGDGQSPDALFVTCSDSRVNPMLITQAQPGELFMLRNAGNLVPAFGAGDLAAEAAVEYAVVALKVPHIVVCGHSQCGAMTGLMAPDKLESMPRVAKWLEKAETTRRILQENYTHLTAPEKRLEAAIEENVLVQLENLRTHPSVAAAMARRELSLHAWVYAFEKGEVYVYDQEKEQFAPLSP